MTKVHSRAPSEDLLGDLLSPLAIEGPPSSTVHPQPSTYLGFEDTEAEARAIVPAEGQAHSVQVLL